jgi:hypothetical protein
VTEHKLAVPPDAVSSPCPKCGNAVWPSEIGERWLGFGLRLYGLRHICTCGARFLSWPLILEEEEAP